MALPTFKEIVFNKKGYLKGLYDMIVQVSEGEMEAGSVETADISDEAVTLAKLADLTNEADILVANTDKRPVSVAVSGDVALAKTGAMTIANGAITEAKIGTGAVTSGKIGNNEVTGAKLRGDGKGGNGAGYTIALLTTAFGDPATLPDYYRATYRDTTANKTYDISVYSGVFYGVEQTAVPSGA